MIEEKENEKELKRIEKENRKLLRESRMEERKKQISSQSSKKGKSKRMPLKKISEIPAKTIVIIAEVITLTMTLMMKIG